MSFTPAKVFQSGYVSSRTGITASGRLLKGDRICVQITFCKDAQEDLFDGCIVGKSFDIEIGRGNEQGLLKIRENEGGAFKFSAFGAKDRGLASVKISGWDLLPKEPLKKADCTVLDPDGGDGFILKLPSWANVKDTTLRA